MRFATFFVALSVAFAAQPASALTVSDDAAVGSVRSVITTFIQPSFERFADQTGVAVAAVSALCDKPDEARLASARAAFADTALAFARVEFLRTGPLLKDNRIERLLFWPDRRGIALRQVQAEIAATDDDVTDPAALGTKSVALQGFTALEYLLYGTGSEALAQPGGEHRCAFARAVAGNIEGIARAMDAEWNAPDGPAAAWSKPGPDNADYRDAAESISELVGLPANALEMIHDQRIKPLVADAGGKANPKSALFWRSGLTFAFFQAEFDALGTYFELSRMPDILPTDKRWLASSALFEFGNATKTLAKIQMPVAEVLDNDAAAADLRYLGIVTKSLQSIFGGQIPDALGLTVGFSSLDGD